MTSYRPLFIFGKANDGIVTLRLVAHPCGSVLYTRATRVCISRYNSPIGVANYRVHPVTAPSKGLAPRLVAPCLRNFTSRRRSRPKTVCLSRYARLNAVCAPSRLGTVASLTRRCNVQMRVSNTHVTGTYTSLKLSLQTLAISYNVSILDFNKAGGKLVVKRYIVMFSSSLGSRTHFVHGRSTRLTSGVHCLSYRFATCLASRL